MMRMKKRTFITRITALIMAVLLAVGMLPNTMVRAEQPDVFDSYSDSNDLSEYYEVKPLTLLADNEEEPVVHYDDIALLSEQEDITVNSESELYKYLSKKMAERSTQINIILPNDINNSIGGPVNAYTNAIAYSDSCSGQEADAIRYGGTGFRVSTGYYSSQYTKYSYTMTYYTTAEQEEELTAAVNSAMDSMNLNGKTEAEKVKLIHDYICDKVDYDYSGLSDSSNLIKYTAYAALCEGKAVCQGYAILFYRMCKEAGLSVRIISGTGNGGPHAWNIVKVDNAYYNVDSTWDGQDSTTLDTYLLLNEKDFSSNHTRNSEYTTDEFYETYPMGLVSYYKQNPTYDTPLETMNWEFNYSAIDGNTVSTKANGKSKLLIYFSTNCGNSRAVIKSLSDKKYTDLDIIAINANQASLDDVKTFKNTYGSDNVIFTYGNSLNGTMASSNMWNYVYMKDSSMSSIYYPVIVYVDGNDNVQQVTTGYQELSVIQNYLEYYCGIQNGDSVFTVKYRPNGGDGDEIVKTYNMKSTAEVLNNPYNNTGYVFKGWNTKFDGSGDFYTVGSKISNPKTNIILYAQWEKFKQLENVTLGEFMNTKDGIVINWEEVEGAENYIVYRRIPGGRWSIIANYQYNTNYIDKTAVNGVEYYYTVRAVSGEIMSPGFDSTKSITCIKTLANVELGEFKNIKTGVEINWNSVMGAERYIIYRRVAGGKWSIIAGYVKDTSYTDKTAVEGTEYYYTVRAVSGDMMSPGFDATRSIIHTKTLANVTLGEFKNTKAGVEINWEEVKGAERYIIYRRVAGGKWSIIAGYVKDTSYTDKTAVEGTEYYYTVRAVSGDMMSPGFDDTKKIICK